jgi:hypothetical protein
MASGVHIRQVRMHTMARLKLVLALVGIVFLLANPAGVCAGTPSAQSPSHPWCPTHRGPAPHGSSKSACVCLDRQPAAPILPQLDEGVALLGCEISSISVPYVP